jgi:hypothetical protein
MASPLDKVAKRFGITAREARDIATAVGSAAQAVRKSPQENIPVKKIVKNVAKQVKETGKAATTGKRGTSAYKLKPNPASQKARKESGNKSFVTYNVSKPEKRGALYEADGIKKSQKKSFSKILKKASGMETSMKQDKAAAARAKKKK